VALAHTVAGVAGRKTFEVKREPARLEVVRDRLRVMLMILDRRLRRHRQSERCGEHADRDEDSLPHVFLLVPPIVYATVCGVQARRLWTMWPTSIRPTQR